MSKKIFISYKWGSDEHNAWVERLYKSLRYRGIDAKLDKFEVPPGGSFSDYMTRGVREADYVLFIVNEAAVQAVENGSGALAFEMQIANARRLAAKGPFSIIPILREGNHSSTYLSDHRYIDFRDNATFEESLTELIRWLNDEIIAPDLGVNVWDPRSITNALPYLKTLRVSGYETGNPQHGQTGEIQLPGGVLRYIRKDTGDRIWHGPWTKRHYQFELQWDTNENGVVAISRLSASDK